jgi:hypothetical protein
MQLTLEERTVAQAVDMSVLAGAESFIGAGVRSQHNTVPATNSSVFFSSLL